MLFSASIVLATVVAVAHGHIITTDPPLPSVTSRAQSQNGRAIVQQACTLPNGGGVCTPLPDNACADTPGLQSLILNSDTACDAFPLAQCESTPELPVFQQSSDDSSNLVGKGIQSVSCGNVPI
ncbi:hypothetical protein B0H19DRAFT_1258561 [Mycena capillaripes]|nr:hypothetical protein B0H19DRAFT_1258561 [Mycena capillaripes]